MNEDDKYIPKYSFINRIDGERRYLSQDGPLLMPDYDDGIWRDIDEKVKSFSMQDSAGRHEDEVIIFNENSNNLIFGAVNLINTIIDRHQSEPIKTLVFLDKSARLAAHVFRKLWVNLEKQDKLPNGLDMPKIKFINVGLFENHKHESTRSSQLPKGVFPKDDLEGAGVLVVDEIISSGGSARRAMDLLADTYQSNPQGIANFNNLPTWYYHDSKKGIEDPNLPIEVYDFLEKIDMDVFNILESLINSNIPKDFILEFLSDSQSMNVQDFLIKYNKTKSQKKKKIYTLIYKELKNTPDDISTEIIFKYFKTYGGFLAMRMDVQKQKLSNRYRKYLSKMVELASKQITLQKS